MKLRRAALLSTLAALAAPAAAQLRPGEAIFVVHTPNPGLFLIDRSGGCRPVTGALQQFANDAVQLDPVDSSIWIGNSFGPGSIRRVRLQGDAVASETMIANASPFPLTGLTFDLEGNPVVTSDWIENDHGVFRVDRNPPHAVTHLVGRSSGLIGFANCITTDPLTGDLYFGATGNSTAQNRVYRLPPPYTTPVLVGSIAPLAGTSAYLSSIAFHPFLNGGTLFITSSSLSATLVQMDLATGTPVNVPLVPAPGRTLNWIDFDWRQQDFWAGTVLFNPTLTFLVQANGATSPLTSCGGGNVAALDVHDRVPGTLVAMPRSVPVPTGPTTLEVGVWCQPGEIGVIAIVQPFVSVLAALPADRAGSVSVRLPGLVVPAGTPGRVQFLAARVDPTTLGVQLTSPLHWPAN
jgi:hypothetical protein